MKVKFRTFSLAVLVIGSSTAFVYSLGLWLNFDACSPKFQFLTLAVLLSFFGGVIYFLNGIKLNPTTIKNSYFHGVLVFVICCLYLFGASVEYFYLLWSSVFFHYFTKNFPNSKSEEIFFKETIHDEDQVDYYSSYLFVKDCQAIYKSSLNTSKFNSFFYKFFGFCFCFYSYVSYHSKLCVLILWWPSLLIPVLVLKLVLAWFLWGSFLFFLCKTSALPKSYNLIFEGKTYFKFSNQTNGWLLKLAGILALSFLLGLGFGLDLVWFSKCLVNCYGKTALVLWYTPIQFFPFNFCLASVIFLIGTSYLMYYSYQYSSQSWVFVFNACHFLVYLFWGGLLDYKAVAIFCNLSVEWLLVGTALYPVFWIMSLVFSVRFSTGSWDEFTSYFSQENFERRKTLKPFTLSSGIKTIHEARLLHSLSSTKSSYNCTYMITIVHLYALAGWVIYHGAKLNWLVNLFCLLFFKEIFPVILVCTAISFLFLLNLHTLSRDPVWYAHFRKANGHYVLANLGWNMLRAAALNTGKILAPVATGGAGYFAGEIKGYLAGYADGIKEASGQKSDEISPSGIRVSVESWDLSGEHPRQKTQIILPKFPLISETPVITLTKRIPVSLVDLRLVAKDLLVKGKVPEAYTHWKETGEIPVTVMFSINAELKHLNEEKPSALPQSTWGQNLRRPWHNPDLPVLQFPEALPRPNSLDRGRAPRNYNEWDPDPSTTIARCSIFDRDWDWWNPDPSSTIAGRSIFAGYWWDGLNWYEW